MNTATELERHSQVLLAGIARQVSAPAFDQLVANVTHALAASLANGDGINVSGADVDQRLNTQLQVLNALNQSYAIKVTAASLVPEQRQPSSRSVSVQPRPRGEPVSIGCVLGQVPVPV